MKLVDARTYGVRQEDWHAYVRESPLLSAGPPEASASSCRRFVSRSYRYPWALVAHYETAVGVDIERRDAVGETDLAFARATCTPAELDRLCRSSHPSLVDLWSGKEALTKALGDPLRYDPRRIDSPCEWSSWRAIGPRPGILGQIRRRGSWAAAPLLLGGDAARECTAWVVWRLPEAP